MLPGGWTQTIQMANIFLTGSQNLGVLRSAAESMAGSVGILNLEGMTPYEIMDTANNSWLEDYLSSPETLFQKTSGRLKSPPIVELLWRGSLPGILNIPNTKEQNQNQ